MHHGGRNPGHVVLHGGVRRTGTSSNRKGQRIPKHIEGAIIILGPRVHNGVGLFVAGHGHAGQKQIGRWVFDQFGRHERGCEKIATEQFGHAPQRKQGGHHVFVSVLVKIRGALLRGGGFLAQWVDGVHHIFVFQF